MKAQKMAWWKTGYGKMDRQMQGDFERAQKIAQESGKPCTITLTIIINPPRTNEPEYMPVKYKRKLTEPAYASAECDLVLRDGVAVSDAEQHPDQVLLDFEEKNEITLARAKKAAV